MKWLAKMMRADGIHKKLLVGMLLMALVVGLVGCGCECAATAAVFTGVAVPIIQMIRDAAQEGRQDRKMEQLKQEFQTTASGRDHCHRLCPDSAH